MTHIQRLQKLVDAAWYSYWIWRLKLAARLIDGRACIINADFRCSNRKVVIHTKAPVLLHNVTIVSQDNDYGVLVKGGDF